MDVRRWGRADVQGFMGFNCIAAGAHVPGVFHYGFVASINEHAANMFTVAGRKM